MTTNEKMTYVTALTMAINGETLTPEALEKLTVLREQTAKRNTSHSSKPTAKQTANAELAETVYSVMLTRGEPMTVSDVIHANEGLITYSTQKISAIMNLLEGAGKVAKTTEKRKSYFTAILQA